MNKLAALLVVCVLSTFAWAADPSPPNYYTKFSYAYITENVLFPDCDTLPGSNRMVTGGLCWDYDDTVMKYWNGSAVVGVNAATATALAADPSDCSANQYANAIAASGNLSCAAISDADVPDTITIDNATTANTLIEAPTLSVNVYNIDADGDGTADSVWCGDYDNDGLLEPIDDIKACIDDFCDADSDGTEDRTFDWDGDGTAEAWCGVVDIVPGIYDFDADGDGTIDDQDGDGTVETAEANIEITWSGLTLRGHGATIDASALKCEDLNLATPVGGGAIKFLDSVRGQQDFARIEGFTIIGPGDRSVLDSTCDINNNGSPSCTGNWCPVSRYHGILVGDYNTVWIENNVISGTDAQGIKAAGGTELVVRGNYVENQAEHCYTFAAYTNALIDGNIGKRCGYSRGDCMVVALEENNGATDQFVISDFQCSEAFRGFHVERTGTTYTGDAELIELRDSQFISGGTADIDGDGTQDAGVGILMTAQAQAGADVISFKADNVTVDGFQRGLQTSTPSASTRFENIAVTNSRFLNCSETDGVNSACVVLNAQGFLFKGNEILDNDRDGTLSDNAILVGDSDNLIKFNRIAGFSAVGVKIAANAARTVVESNEFISNADSATAGIQAVLGGASNGRFIKNIFRAESIDYDGDGTADTVDFLDGIAIQRDGNFVADNIIEDCDARNIYLDGTGANNNTIVRNLMRDGTHGTVSNCIRHNNVGSGNYYAFNVCMDALVEAFDLNAESQYDVMNTDLAGTAPRDPASSASAFYWEPDSSADGTASMLDGKLVVYKGAVNHQDGTNSLDAKAATCGAAECMWFDLDQDGTLDNGVDYCLSPSTFTGGSDCDGDGTAD